MLLVTQTCWCALSFYYSIYSCPTCGESLVDMSMVWQRLDVEAASTPMPDEYKDMRVQVFSTSLLSVTFSMCGPNLHLSLQVLCKDCHKVMNWSLSLYI